MDIGSISTLGNSSFVASTTPLAPVRQGLRALDNALLAGNLDQAQTAFNAIGQAVGALQGTNSTAPLAALGQPGTTLGTDLAAVGKAISAADLGAAQKAFAQLQTDLVAARQAAAAASPFRPPPLETLALQSLLSQNALLVGAAASGPGTSSAAVLDFLLFNGTLTGNGSASLLTSVLDGNGTTNELLNLLQLNSGSFTPTPGLLINALA